MADEWLKLIPLKDFWDSKKKRGRKVLAELSESRIHLELNSCVVKRYLAEINVKVVCIPTKKSPHQKISTFEKMAKLKKNSTFEKKNPAKLPPPTIFFHDGVGNFFFRNLLVQSSFLCYCSEYLRGSSPIFP